MKIKAFGVRGHGPIELVAVDDIASVAVLAGPNGVGKTSVVNGLLQLAQNPTGYANDSAPLWMVLEATNGTESSRWGQNTVDTRIRDQAENIARTLHANRRRNKYSSSFLNFDSDRAIRNIQPFNFSWDITNPFLEEIGWNTGFTRLTDRYNDVRHSLYKMVESQRRELADTAIRLRLEGQGAMPLDFPDVLAPFKEAFYSLLGPKILSEVNVKEQQIYYETQGNRLPIETLSSGEREVVNIVFDFILRNPTDCVIMFDEPELHLHPELSYRMLQTLSRIGSNNQFFFSTHSPEIISASLENTVVFVRPRRDDGSNQAVVVHREDETHHALQALGQSIGVISLGKRLVLIEGNEASLDKQTYGAILKNRFPELILVPAGGKDALKSFDEVKGGILDKTIWGVEFYLLCDRDAVNYLGPNALSGYEKRDISKLDRYHLENYFLDAKTIARMFCTLEAEGSWLRDPAAVDAKLRSIAKEVVPYAVALNVNAAFRERVGNVSLMPRAVDQASDADALVALIRGRVEDEQTRVSEGLTLSDVEDMTRKEYARLMSLVDAGGVGWLKDIPGRPVLNKFAAASGIQVGRFKQLYLSNADEADVFGEIIKIFEEFSQFSQSQQTTASVGNPES